MQSGAIPFWNAFAQLHAERGRVPFGLGGIAPLSITSRQILDYFELEGFRRGDAREVVKDVVRAVDRWYMEWVEERLGK